MTAAKSSKPQLQNKLSEVQSQAAMNAQNADKVIQKQMQMEQCLVATRIEDIAQIHVLESRLAALEEEDIDIYELSMAQMDSYEVRCRKLLEDLYNDYLVSLRQLLPTCRFPDSLSQHLEDPDGSGGAGANRAGISRAGTSEAAAAKVFGSRNPAIIGFQQVPNSQQEPSADCKYFPEPCRDDFTAMPS